MVQNTKNGSGISESHKIEVNTQTVVGSTYAQIVGVIVNDTDITLEFAYANPRPPVQQAVVVARVTMPRTIGENVATTILTTVRQHEETKKRRKNV